jgi:hypothetical protein
MRVIAHRGNLEGPDKAQENSIKSTFNCLYRDLDVELDIHVKNNLIYLDHDGILSDSTPCIDLKSFCKEFDSFQDKLWLHCKNLEAVIYCQANLQQYNYFGHSNDEFVLTSKGYIFTRPNVATGKNVVCVMPELCNLKLEQVKKYESVLTDYPLYYL